MVVHFERGCTAYALSDLTLVFFYVLHGAFVRLNVFVCASQRPQDNELFLFGGEIYDGTKTKVYGEFYRYNTDKETWTLVVSPNSPPPRSAHQVSGFFMVIWFS
jgi:hypothetical protein